MTRTAWYPRAQYAEVLRWIATIHEEPERSYKTLVACGRGIFEREQSTPMKLLLKGMSARLFVRKFPDFWGHDMRGGSLTVDSSELANDRVTMCLTDVAGFDHIGPVGVGFIGRALELVTGKRVEANLTGWSFTSPAPDELSWHFAW